MLLFISMEMENSASEVKFMILGEEKKIVKSTLQLT